MTSVDRVRAAVLVKVPQAEAFRVFVEEIDQWWRRGLAYRMAGARRGIIHIEARLGGRMFESFDAEHGERVVESGRVLVWEPPARFVLSWRAINFAPEEQTEVEVRFEPSVSGTLVTVTHRGWEKIRGDHPVRHGQPSAAFLRMKGLWWGTLLSALREHLEP